MKRLQLLVLALLLTLVVACAASTSSLNQRTSARGPGVAYLVHDADLTVLWAARRTRTVQLQTDGAGLGKVSPDGAWIAEADFKELRVVSSRTPGVAKTILRVTDGAIDNFVWSNDSRALAYVVELKKTVPSGQYPLYGVYSISADGKARRVIKAEFPRPLVLERFDPKTGTVLWFETGEGGGLLDLSSVSVERGAVHHVAPDTPVLFGDDFSVASDGGAMFYVARARGYGIRVVRLDLHTRRLSTIYSLPREDRDHGVTISHLLLSPSESSLVFSLQSAGLDATRIVRVSTSSGRASIALDRAHGNLIPTSWSPEGRYLWMDPACVGAGCGASHYLLDLQTRQLELVFEEKYDYESLDFVGWIS